MLDTQYFIDVTGIDHAKLLRRAYALSGGDGTLTNAEVKEALAAGADDHNVLYVPQINGVHVALAIQRWDGREWMFGVWHKHTGVQLAELLEDVRLTKPAPKPVAIVAQHVVAPAPSIIRDRLPDPEEVEPARVGFVEWLRNLFRVAQ